MRVSPLTTASEQPSLTSPIAKLSANSSDTETTKSVISLRSVAKLGTKKEIPLSKFAMVREPCHVCFYFMIDISVMRSGLSCSRA